MVNKKLRVGLDARVLVYPRSGLSAYLVSLIEELKRYPDIEVFLFSDRNLSEEYEQIVGDLSKVIFGFKYRKYWANYLLGTQLKKYSIDIYHANWDGGIPFFSPCPSIMTLHSITPIKRPPGVKRHMFKRRAKRVKYWLTFQIEKRIAKKIIVVSEYMKNYIHRYAHIPLKKMVVIYLGVDRNFKEIKDTLTLNKKLEEYNLKNKKFILTIPTRVMEEHKNIPTLIKSFEYIFFKYRRNDLYLVIVGEFMQDSNQAKEFLFGRVSKDVQKNIVFLGHVKREDLPYLLNGCEVMVFPSLYEGFGLPIVEAFACGTAVVASNISCIPEIAGDAALLVDPFDYKKLGEEIMRVITDSRVKNILKRRGLQRAKEFSWKRNAEVTYRIYREVTKSYK